MSPGRRWTVISIAAVGTAVAAFLVPEDRQVAETALPVERPRAPQPQQASSKPLDTQLPVRKDVGRQRGDPFATLTWAPPPKPAASEEPPAKPQPPANPYRFAGTVHQGGVRMVFLVLPDGRVVEAREGATLEHGFRVKSVSDRSVTLVYEQMPDQPVTVAFTEPGPAAAASGASVPPLPPPPR